VSFSLGVTMNHSLGVGLNYIIRYLVFISMTLVIEITTVIKIFARTIVTIVIAKTTVNAMT